jgi:uncharacterized repeat protein (TIGR01451 family)
MTRIRQALSLSLVATAALAVAPAGAAAATADLAVDATDSADPVNEGTEFSYVLAVTNAGPDAGNGVELSNDLPNQLDFIAANPTQGSCGRQGKKVTCQLGTIPSGGQATVTLRVVPRKAGQLVDAASVTTADTDPVSANNTDTEQTTVVEPPAPAECAGQAASVVGTAGDDQLTGTAGTDVFVALGGNDTIIGLGGDDLVCGKGGADVIRTAGGDDLVRAGGGNDRVKGGNDRDELRGGGSRDRLAGGAGADALDGGTGSDRCAGGPGRDSERRC